MNLKKQLSKPKFGCNYCDKQIALIRALTPTLLLNRLNWPIGKQLPFSVAHACSDTLRWRTAIGAAPE
jgi:hypothetical protein